MPCWSSYMSQLCLTNRPTAAAAYCSFIWLLVPLLFHSGLTAKEKPIQYEIFEETPPGVLIGDGLIVDARLDVKYNQTILNMLTFTFLTQSANREFFELDEDSGKLFTKQKLDRDQTCPRMVSCDINLDVAVRPVHFFQVIKILIHVIDINDNAPKFPKSRIQSPLSESTVPGILFPIPTASDPDSPKFGVKRYELISDSNTFELRVRNSSDGTVDLHLVLKEMLDREKIGSYQVQIVAYDGDVPPQSGSVMIDITVNDINDNSPRFLNTSYEVKIPENVKVNTTLVNVQARDPDSGPNGQITYGFTDRTRRAHGDMFGINPTTGEVYLKAPLDTEVRATYSLAVTAQDKGPDSLPTPTKVIIHVLDINDHAPRITINPLTNSEHAEIPEDSDYPIFVAHVSVMDPDRGQNGLFICSLQNQKFELVQLYDTEFKIMAVSRFDREVQPEYNVFVVCTDEGSPPKMTSSQLKVIITDKNDNRPKFSEQTYFADIKENNLIGASIIQVTATDRDVLLNGQLEYYVDEDANKYVSIDPRSGVIRARAVFDREDKQSKEFQVFAVDYGTPRKTGSAEVLVNIGDQDDQPPIFTHPRFVMDVEENLPRNTEVGKVKAHDEDLLPPNTEFTFSIAPNQLAARYFTIDPQTGIISTTQPLDREEQDFYSLKVVVTSVGRPIRNNSAIVMIHVQDQNDNVPVIDWPTRENNTVLLSNQVPLGYMVTQVLAHDVDYGINAKLSYVISEGNENGEFTMGLQTGEIFVNTDLHDYNGRTLRLVIMVKDFGLKRAIAVAPVLITMNETVPFIIGPIGGGKTKFPLSDMHMTIIIGVAAGSALLAIVLIIAIIILKKKKVPTATLR